MSRLLDTNVISEMMRPAPAQAVRNYLDRHAQDGFWVSVITVWEIHNGIRLLEPGKRRDDLNERFNAAVAALFRGRVVPWSLQEASACAEIMEIKRRSGRSLDDHLPDAMIAATAKCRELILVTRNAGEFSRLDIDVENPWR